MSSHNSIINNALTLYSQIEFENRGAIPSTEYFRIDNILWMPLIPEKELKSELLIIEHNSENGYLNQHFWNLLVTVEHENFNHDWTDEITKLMFVRSELRVVIGYSFSKDQVKEIEAANEILNIFSDKVKPDEGAFMLVLGSRSEHLKTRTRSEIRSGYRAYIWNSHEFIEISYDKADALFEETSIGKLNSAKKLDKIDLLAIWNEPYFLAI